jgi:hypothetical protein
MVKKLHYSKDPVIGPCPDKYTLYDTFIWHQFNIGKISGDQVNQFGVEVQYFGDFRLSD